MNTPQGTHSYFFSTHNTFHSRSNICKFEGCCAGPQFLSELSSRLTIRKCRSLKQSLSSLCRKEVARLCSSSRRHCDGQFQCTSPHRSYCSRSASSRTPDFGCIDVSTTSPTSALARTASFTSRPTCWGTLSPQCLHDGQVSPRLHIQWICFVQQATLFWCIVPW